MPSPGLTSQQLQFLSRVTPAAVETEREYRVPACVTIAQAILESATPALGWGGSSLFRQANNPFGIKYCHFPSGHLEPGSAKARAIETSGNRAAGSLPSQAMAATRASGQPINGSSDHPIEDYGHFDAVTWEVEKGQKKTVVAQFQRFPNLREAFRCHALLLSTSPRYAPAMQVLDSRFQVSGSGEDQAVPPDASRQAPDAWKQFAERLGPKCSPNDSEHCGYSTNPLYSAELIRLA